MVWYSGSPLISSPFTMTRRDFLPGLPIADIVKTVEVRVA